MAEPRLLLTRPQAQAAAFAGAVRQRFGTDFGAVIAPLQEIRFVDSSCDPTGFDGLVFTSRNGVAGFSAAFGPGRGPAWCVGQATARAAAAAGFDSRSASGALPDLAAQLRREAAGLTLLYARGAHVAGDLSAIVGETGPTILEVVLYKQQACPLSAEGAALLSGAAPVLLPVFSARSASLLDGALRHARAPLRVAAMSPAVARALPVQARDRVALAQTPDAEGMLNALAELL
jgi:uroporphyrinogen-III synthase